MQELQEARRGFLDSVLVASSHGPHVHPGVNVRLEVPTAEFSKNLREIIGQEAVAGGVVFRPDLRHFPARKIGVDAVEESGVLQFLWQGLKKVSVSSFGLSGFEIRVDVSTKHDGALGREFLIAAAELSGLHVVFQNADAGLGVIKARVGNLIEENEVLETDHAKFAGAFVVEEGCRRGLAAGHHKPRLDVLRKV